MNTVKILIAGFGGQGILFAGKALAFTGLEKGKEVSWLPSYGPEMRGGTANCSVTISDEAIGSPIVEKPDILLAMNRPSFDKYLFETEKGGAIIYDSSLITAEKTRADANIFGIPATRLAGENGLDGLANMIILGKTIRETEIFSAEEIKDSLKRMVPAKRAELLEKNLKAVELGYGFGG